MTEIKLTEEQADVIKNVTDKRDALMQTIESLSLAAFESKKKIWGTLKRWYPEINTEENTYKYDPDRGVIIKID